MVVGGGWWWLLLLLVVVVGDGWWWLLVGLCNVLTKCLRSDRSGRLLGGCRSLMFRACGSLRCRSHLEHPRVPLEFPRSGLQSTRRLPANSARVSFAHCSTRRCSCPRAAAPWLPHGCSQWRGNARVTPRRFIGRTRELKGGAASLHKPGLRCPEVVLSCASTHSARRIQCAQFPFV